MRNHRLQAIGESIVSSNGLASGNTTEEALCHAVFEVVERNALSIWGTMSKRYKANHQINLDSVDPKNKALAMRFLDNDIELKVWEITDKTGLPTYHCAIHDPSPMHQAYVHTGTGCHLDKHIALSRALMEAAQARLAIISGSRDDIFPSYYAGSPSLNWQPSPKGIKDFMQCQTIPLSGDILTDLTSALEYLDQAGYQDLYYVDHTKEGVDIPVVQVFIPGMQFSMGRM